MIYVQLVLIALILASFVVEWKYGKGNIVACLGLLVALFSTPYFTLPTELERHHQQILWNERYSSFQEQLYHVNSVHHNFQYFLKATSLQEFPKVAQQASIDAISVIDDDISKLVLNGLYYEMVLGEKTNTVLENYLKELQPLVQTIKENLFKKEEINSQQLSDKEYDAFLKYRLNVLRIYTEDFEYGK